MPAPVKYVLPESEIPTSWTNLMADLGPPEHPPLHPGTCEPLNPEDLAPLFPMALIEQEMSAEPEIPIPDEVREIYAMWRPTPLFRARRLEKAHRGELEDLEFSEEDMQRALDDLPQAPALA